MERDPARSSPADVDAVAHAFVESLVDELTIVGADGHHLTRVRRLQPGEIVTAADGHGVWRPYLVGEAVPGRLRLVAMGPPLTEPVLRPRLALAFALTKGSSPEIVARQATELGVDRLVPVEAARTVARWRGGRSGAAVDRLRRVVREAATQCRRARVPDVEPVVPLRALANRPGVLVADRRGVPATERPDPPNGEWTVVVGPEGGFTPDEIDELGRPPSLAVGPHVLRAETAAVAALAALAPWRQSSDFRGGLTAKSENPPGGRRHPDA